MWPETTEARCWVHKVANCLNALPKSVQPTAFATVRLRTKVTKGPGSENDNHGTDTKEVGTNTKELLAG